MKIKKEIIVELNVEDFMSFIGEYNKLSMYDIADKSLSQVSWHDNMPKSSKLKYIKMLKKHISEFEKNLNVNDDMSALANER